jgi:hypothetical protein
MAVKSALKLGNEFSTGTDFGIDIEIQISINGVEKIEGVAGIPYTSIIHTRSVIGADANICGGFLSALRSEPDYLWILSANEILASDTLKNLDRLIENHPECELFVANSDSRQGVLELDNVFLDVPSKLGLGLISGVVYQFNATKNSYPQAVLFNWLGWGQLAVIQNYLSSTSKPLVREFPDSQIYAKPFTYTPLPNQAKSEREIVRNLYTHSFFGLPVLAFCLLGDDKKKLRRFQLRWIALNWYKINLFSKNLVFGDELTLQRTRWIFWLCRSSFKLTSVPGFLFRVCGLLPVEKLQQLHTAESLLSMYKKKVAKNV